MQFKCHFSERLYDWMTYYVLYATKIVYFKNERVVAHMKIYHLFYMNRALFLVAISPMETKGISKYFKRKCFSFWYIVKQKLKRQKYGDPN